MKIGKFVTYTVIGSAMWNMLLMYAGYLLGSNWEVIRTYSETIDKVMIGLIIAAIFVWWFWRRRSKKIVEAI
jgi:membrane protein DedA with SNARE-associated domain